MRHRERTVRYQPEDRVIYNGMMDYLCRNWKEDVTIAVVMINIGKYFLGTPYVRNTLDMKGRENLVINLREFDCFTFVENVVVIAWLLGKGECTFEDYTVYIERIRYRDGVLHEYPSRLHYFSDWLSDNIKKGIVKDVTCEMGRKPYLKKILYMTSHREHYPVLKSERICRDMQVVERNLSDKTFYYIPKEDLSKHTMAIEEGDIIAITTDVEGLDILHVGIALCHDREIHLLHASEIEKKVVISEETLPEYLLNRDTMTGIMVGRVK